MTIQLLPLSTSSSKSLGASGRKSCGLLQPSSQITLTMAAVTLGSSFSSINRSLIFGQVGLSVSGYTSANRYSVTIVFFRTAGLECVSLGSRSESTDIAREDVMMCGRVMIGRDIVVADVAVKSCKSISSQPSI